MSGKRRMYTPEEYLGARRRNYMILGIAGIACVIATYVSMVANDNHMSISRNVGFVARHLANLRAKSGYIRFKRGLTAALESSMGVLCFGVPTAETAVRAGAVREAEVRDVA